MKIETSYSIGQYVYTVFENMAVCAKVTSISVYVSEKYSKSIGTDIIHTEITYSLCDRMTDKSFSAKEENCFPTKEALFEHMSKLVE